MSAPFGSLDGIYRYVSLYRLPLYLADGWTICHVEPGYSVLMRAPIPPALLARFAETRP